MVNEDSSTLPEQDEGEGIEIHLSFREMERRARPGHHSNRPLGANLPHQRANSPTGKAVVLLVPGYVKMDYVNLS